MRKNTGGYCANNPIVHFKFQVKVDGKFVSVDRDGNFQVDDNRTNFDAGAVDKIRKTFPGGEIEVIELPKGSYSSL